MKDTDKTKEQLIDELMELRQKISELQMSDFKYALADEMLFRRNSGLKNFINTAPDVLHFKEIRSDSHVVLAMNRASNEVVDMIETDMMDKTGGYMLAPDLAKYCRPNDTEVIGGCKTLRSEEVSGENGEKIFENIKSPLYDGRGIVMGLVDIKRDITERKHTEWRLKESEQRFRIIFENAVDGIVLADMENKRFHIGNRMIHEMLGYTPEEFKNLSVMDIHPRERLPHVIREFEKQARGEVTLSSDIPVKRKDGGIFYADINATPVFLSGRRYLMGIFRDVTSRKQTEERLRTLSYAIEQSPTSVVVADARGVIEYVNPRFSAVTGYAPGEAVGQRMSILRSGAHPPEFYRGLRDTIASGRVWRGDICNRKKNGELFWELLSISPIRSRENGITHFVIVTIDDTERRRAEESLRRSEERLIKAQHIARLGIWELDIVNGVVTLSEEIRGILGISREETRTTSEFFLNLVHPDDRELVKGAVDEAIYKKKPFSIDFRTLRPDGAVNVIHSEAEVAFDPSGGPLRMVGVMQDITERKKMEQELLKVQKLESVGLLAGGIAHDYNNILTAIMGNISLAKMSINPEDRAFKKLADAEKATLRARNLTQQLLTFSTGGAPIKKKMFIGGLIKESADFALAGSRARCEYMISPELAPVEADEGQIRQVIHNLITNADQAMPEGGTIKIIAGDSVVKENDALPLDAGAYVRIRIEDQGIGIPEENLRKIFDPFFTTRNKARGLGLTAAYSIIKNHGGCITAESRAGAGAAFNIYLPASETEIRRENDAGGRLITGKGRILVMDDEEMLREAAGEMLAHLGYDVELAADGVEAIELYLNAKDSGKPFDAVIMDLTIPGGMGGMEAVKRILELDPAAKAIVSSGYSNDPVMSDFRKYGFMGVIVKPYKIEELSKEVHKMIEGRL